jgi:2-oxoglutarate dehydrogenase E2 component (dihydrolipoamide succinyltransferase)
MATDVKVPPLPESIEEATLSAWHKKIGDRVREGEKLADLETDKIVIEVPAPSDGFLTEIRAKEGSTLHGSDVIATIDAATGARPAAPAEPAVRSPPPPPPVAPAPVRQAEKRPAPAPARLERPPAAEPAAEPMATAAVDEAMFLDLSPAVRKLVEEQHLNPAEIRGTGRGGRITKADVIRHVEHSPHLTTKFGDTSTPALPPEAARTALDQRPQQRVRMTRIRARIAERLVEAQRNAAILTTFNEVNMAAVIELRAKFKDEFEKEHGIKLGFMSFFVKAAVAALMKYPIINASVDGDEIVYHGFFDIGVAVSTTRGLVVPILKHADRMSLAEIEGAVSDFAKRAEDGHLGMDELTGGTFSISNGGVFGSLLSTPILNPPQSAILGMHRIQQRPVVEGGQIVARPMMYLALSYDHRIIDGRDAVLFLVAVKEAVEDPLRLMLQV